MILDWKEPYEPATANNKQLADDWRLFVAAIANLNAGKDEPFTYEDIYKWATACLREIIKRVKAGKMNFSISKKKSNAYQQLWQAVRRKINTNTQIITDAVPGLILVSPHAELVATGKKTLIVKSRDYSALCNQDLAYCASNLCFGTLKMKPPRKCKKADLAELYPLHRITPEEIEAWWPGKDEFFLYDIYDVTTWKKPRHADIPAGPQVSIKNINFLDSKHRRDRCMSCENPPAYEVLWAEGIGHAWFCKKHLEEWATKGDGRGEIISVKEVKNGEASKKFSENANPNIWAKLKVEIHADSEELAPVNPSGIEIGEEITRDEILKYFKSFYRTKPYVSLVGGLCTQGKTKGDIDLFINSNHRDIATEFRIIRMFPQEYWYRFRFRYPFQEETHPGKFTNYMDIFNELIEVVPAKELVLMSAPKKVELFKFTFPLLKPARAHHKGEEYTVDALIEVVNAQPEWYEKGIYLQRKFDGVHVRCDIDGSRAVIFSEEGNELTKNLPTLASELIKMANGHKVVITGELEYWEDKTHQSRQQTTAIIHTKGVHPDEGKVILNVFDCLFFGEDIHNIFYSIRFENLKRLKFSKFICLAETRLVDNPTDLRKAVEHFAVQKGSEGSYLKRSDFPYELDGKTLLNLKYKNTFSIDAKVVDVHSVEGATAWNYLCVIEDLKGNDVPIGRTYNTSIHVSKGDILKVEFVNLSEYTDPKTKKVFYNWWAPRVLMAREDKKKPDNTLTAKKLVDASRGTVAEKPWPTRYEDGAWVSETDDVNTNPYMTYPDQTKKWKGMVHCHGRGRSIHLDFRVQFSADFAIGWTLYIPKSFSQVPQSHTEFKKLVDAEIVPLVKDTMSNPMKKFNCGQKEPEPIEWLTYEGMVQPGQVGATKNEPGFFYIIDSFEVQFGSLKSYYSEYFCDGKIFNGRLIFRLLANRKEWKKTGEGLMTWMMFASLKSPYVISARAVEKKWVTPAGASALPRKIRDKIPLKFHYWTVKDTSKRRALRDELVDAIKKKILSLDALSHGNFKFLKQTWKGQKVIREGPSKTQFYFVFKDAKDIWAIALNADLTEQQSAAGLVFTKADALWDTEGVIAPGTKLNTTKNTPSNISILDKGAASMFTETENTFKKFILKGKSLKGVWVAYQQEESKMWTFRKSEMPEPEK